MTPAASKASRFALPVSYVVIAAYWIACAIRESSVPTTIAMVPGSVAIKALIASALIFPLLHWSGEPPEVLGLRSKPLLRPLLLGLAFGALLFVLSSILVGPIMKALLGGEPMSKTLLTLLLEPRNLPFWFAGALLAGYVEELMRIFVITRFERLGRPALVAALLVDSIAFGLIHRYQGLSAVVTNLLFGIGMGVLFLRRRSAVELMTAHAVNDLIAISLALATLKPGA